MKQSNTKKALFLSVLSLVLCIAMLIGTTFAWFTDSASTKNNRIIAGNLDVDLVMDKTANGTYTSIADSTGDLFKEAGYAQNSNASLWEPGKTQIVYLGVQNKGNLALKYNILVNTEDIDGTPSMVQNGVPALEFALLDETKASDLSSVTNWSDLKAMATAKGDLTIGQFMAAENGCLDEIINGTENETDYFALAVHMKESAGNEYMNAGIVIDMTVKATQKDAESDTFDSTYDSLAAFPNTDSTTKTIVANKDTKITAMTAPLDGKTTTATFPKEIASFVAGKDAVLNVEASPILNANQNFTVSSEGAVGAIDLKVKVDGTEITEFKDSNGDAVPVTIVTYIAKGFTNVTLQYNQGTGVQPTNVTYDPATGKLTFKTTHFSTYVVGANETTYVSNNNTAYLTMEEAITNTSANDTITLLKNISKNHGYLYNKNYTVTLDLNQKTLKANGSTSSVDGGRAIKITSGKMIIKNGTIDGRSDVANPSSGGPWSSTRTGGCVRLSGGDATLENLTLYNNDGWGNAVKMESENHLIMRNCTVNSVYGAGVEAGYGTTDIYDCKFTQTSLAQNSYMSSCIAACGFGTVNIHNTLVEADAELNAIYVYNSGAVINIDGGKFKAEEGQVIHLDGAGLAAVLAETEGVTIKSEKATEFKGLTNAQIEALDETERATYIKNYNKTDFDNVVSRYNTFKAANDGKTSVINVNGGEFTGTVYVTPSGNSKDYALLNVNAGTFDKALPEQANIKDNRAN